MPSSNNRTHKPTRSLLLSLRTRFRLYVPSKVTLGLCGETLTVIPSVVASSVTCDEAEREGSSWLVAVIVTVLSSGRFVGATYMPYRSIIPLPSRPPTTLLTLHTTEVFAVPVTLAVKPWVRSAGPRR